MTTKTSWRGNTRKTVYLQALFCLEPSKLKKQALGEEQTALHASIVNTRQQQTQFDYIYLILESTVQSPAVNWG